MSIRLAGPRDAAQISRILREAFAEFEPLYTPAGFSATVPDASEIARRFADGPIWVVESEGSVMATVSVVPRDSELYVRSMAVSPSAQGRGYALSLLHAVETFAVQQHYRRLVLNTTPFLLRAIQFYERYGFRYTGEHLDLHGTPLLEMAKELAI